VLRYFEKQDYIRTAIFAYQAVITRAIKPNEDKTETPHSWQNRDFADKRLNREANRDKRPEKFLLNNNQKDKFLLLTEIRNQIAHTSYEHLKTEDKTKKTKTGCSRFSQIKVVIR